MMHVILSHKTLFKKAAVLGLAVIAVTAVLFIAFGKSLFRGHDYYWTKEASSYFVKISNVSTDYFCELSDELPKLCVSSEKNEAFAQENRDNILGYLKSKDFKNISLWLIDNKSGQVYPEGSELPPGLSDNSDTSNLDNTYIPISYKNQYCYLARRTFNAPGRNKSSWSVALSIPAIELIRHLDWDDRIVGINVSTPGKAVSGIDSRDIMKFPLRDYDGAEIAYAYVNTVIDSMADKYLWGWQVILLSIMPILCVILYFYLTYRYFQSFSDHSVMLSKLLKSDKPGIEIFRRDQQVMEKYMPELSELFSLAGESAAEKLYFKKTLEQLGIALEVIEDKGFESKTLSDILEFLLRGAPECGGVILASIQTNEPSFVLGKYNIAEDLIHTLTSTQKGLGFLKLSAKQLTKTSLNDIQGISADSDLADLFSSYESTFIYPLRLKSRLIGVMILVSADTDAKTQFFPSIADLLIELIGVVAYGVLLERDKHLRADGTRILQETSLAISSTLDLPSVLRIVAHRLTDYLEAAYCMILLKSSTSEEVELASFFIKRREGITAPALEKVNLAEFPGLAKAVRANRATVLESQDISELSETERKFFSAKAIESLTVLPIAHSAKFIGSIVLGEEKVASKGAVGGDKLTIIQAIASQAASAIENARLYGFIKQKVDQLTASYNVSAIINSEIEIDHMLSRVLEATKDYLNFNYSIIYSIGENSGLLTPIAYRGFRPANMESEDLSKGNNSIVGLVASTGESVVVDDTRIDSNLKSSFPGALSELAVPIKIADKVVGVFSVGSDSKNAFSNFDEEFLQSLAAQIAVAIGKAKLFDQEKERSKRLKTIYEFSRRTSKTLNIDEVLTLAVESIRDDFECDLVMVMLRKNGSNNFYRAKQSSTGNFAISDLDPESKKLYARTLKTERTLYCADSEIDPDFEAIAQGLKCEVCVPIMSAEKIIGVLILGSKRKNKFSSEDISTIEALTDILAVAIEKSFLFRETTEKAERLSLIDKINTAISTALDIDSFFNVVAKAVSDNAGYKWTLLVVPDGDSFACKAGYSPKSVGDLQPSPVLGILADRLKKVFSTKKAEFVSFADLANLGKPEKLQPAIDAGIRHLVLLPIGESDKCEAVLTVGSSRKDGFTSQELSLLHDITVHLQIAWQNARLYEQLKTAYKQLQEAQDQAIQAEKLRALGEMSSGVVHDFNNILAAILGRVQLMINKVGNMDDQQWLKFFQKNLTVIETAVRDGSSILSRISEFTKKKPTEQFVYLELDQIISDVIEFTKPRWHNQSLAAGKRIDVSFEKSGILSCKGSPSELREVFTNLINNAVDAIKDSGRIDINASVATDRVLVTVHDSGQGMSEDTRKKIFEPFFTTKGKKGTGLGLSVTYGIVNRHGGNIEVESSEGSGTKFKISLPLQVPAKDKKPDKKSVEVKSANGAILVVDDEESLREILAEIIESIGHKVDTASGGVEALKKLSEKTYDLVITDLGMDEVSGWDVADETYTKYPSTKVIVATGWGAQVEKGNLTMHHVNGLIGKPFKIAEIAAIIGEVLSRSRDEVFVDEV